MVVLTEILEDFSGTNFGLYEISYITSVFENEPLRFDSGWTWDEKFPSPPTFPVNAYVLPRNTGL